MSSTFPELCTQLLSCAGASMTDTPSACDGSYLALEVEGIDITLSAPPGHPDKVLVLTDWGPVSPVGLPQRLLELLDANYFMPDGVWASFGLAAEAGHVVLQDVYPLCDTNGASLLDDLFAKAGLAASGGTAGLPGDSAGTGPAPCAWAHFA